LAVPRGLPRDPGNVVPFDAEVGKLAVRQGRKGRTRPVGYAPPAPGCRDVIETLVEAGGGRCRRDAIGRHEKISCMYGASYVALFPLKMGNCCDCTMDKGETLHCSERKAA